MLADLPGDTHDEECTLHDASHSECDPGGPVRARSESNAKDHENGSWSLDAHHRDTESSDDLVSECVDDLREVLDCGEEGGGYAEKCRPLGDRAGHG